MMSRTVRYFKLIYIVAGILVSNDQICETVDAIHIAPRVEVKEKVPQQSSKKVQRRAIEDKPPSAAAAAKEHSWLPSLSFYGVMDRIKNRLLPQWSAFKVMGGKETIQRQQPQQLTIEEIPTNVKEQNWIPKIRLGQVVDRIKSRIRPQWPEFNLWSIPTYFMDYSTNLLYRKFIVNSDCDVIYK